MASQPQYQVTGATIRAGQAVWISRVLVGEPTNTGWHAHPIHQLLYATSGLVSVRLDTATWVIPAGQALLIPPEVRHMTFCLAEICFCSAYIAVDRLGPTTMRMLKVSPLLDASLQALAEEPAYYDWNGRGGYLANLIIDEIKKAPDAPLPLPMPQDTRLQKVCQALIEKPSLSLDIDDWSETVGLSRRTFTRRFRAETQLSFADWRRRLRML